MTAEQLCRWLSVHQPVRCVNGLQALALAIVVTASSSCATNHYQGDGRLVDHGAFAATDRYVLDLGHVDLGESGRYTYTIAGLPSVVFATGLEITEAEPNVNPLQRPPHPGRVRLTVQTAEQETVISDEGPLNSWLWSFGRGEAKSFLYRAKNKADLGDRRSGTTFTPKSGAKYLVTLDVLEAQTTPRPTRLVLKGGGWK